MSSPAHALLPLVLAVPHGDNILKSDTSEHDIINIFFVVQQNSHLQNPKSALNNGIIIIFNICKKKK
jgi:hypothetical protein